MQPPRSRLHGRNPATRAQHDAGGPLPGNSLYNLDETWVNQDGKRAPLSSLRGKLVVAAMGYTTCKDMCPAIVADMMWIDKHLPPEAAKKVSFVFFTFDSVADSPERLQLYAEGHGLDLSRWTLFGSDEDATRELAAALGVFGARTAPAASITPRSFPSLMPTASSSSSNSERKRPRPNCLRN